MTREQKGVAIGALGALSLSILSVGLTWVLVKNGMSWSFSVEKAYLFVSLPLVYAVGTIGNKRFFNETVIQGAGYDQPGGILTVDKAILQNTLEQTVLAYAAYAGFSVVFPVLSSVLLPTLVFLFLAGRICFTLGYKGGAHSRALGFGLTFYPTVLTIVGCVFAVLF